MFKDTEVKSVILAGTQFLIQYIDFRTRPEEFDEAMKVRKVKKTLTFSVRLLHFL